MPGHTLARSSSSSKLEALTTRLDKCPNAGNCGRGGIEELPQKQSLPKDGLMRVHLLENKRTPKVIRELVKRAEPLSKEERLHLERELKLSWYFGGLNVACKETEAGLAIVASGPGSEVRDVLHRLSKEERAEVTVIFPETFEVQVAAICGSRNASRSP